MTRKFQQFDLPPAAASDKANIRQWGFARRELILAVAALLLLVLCLILAGLYGYTEGELSNRKTNPSVFMRQNYCVNQSCLEVAARTLRFMNRTVDPCEDFFNFACGNYVNAKTISYGYGDRSVLTDIYLDNEDRLIAVLEKPIDRKHEGSAERKLKQFFMSCTDTYSREKLLGKPFLDKVVEPLGGWDLLGTWNETKWDFNTALKKVQADFWTRALYKPEVKVDRFNYARYAIELSFPTTTKWLSPYWLKDPKLQIYKDYEKFKRRVGSLLMRDAKVIFDAKTKEAKLDQFVNDTFTVETKVANLMIEHHCFYDDYQKISLNNLSTKTNNVINWVDQLSYLLNETTISGSTEVVVKCLAKFQNITQIVLNLPDGDRKRILHNYLLWRVAEIYVQELSWEYIHANREIYVDLHGTPRFLGVHRYCFNRMGNYMSDALGALFIADHFFDKNRQQVHDITDHLKTVLQEQLDQTPWMDAKTKAYAKDKLDATSFKMGYPEWMASQKLVDSLYDGLKVSLSDFFGNTLRANSFTRSFWSRELKRGEDREIWTKQVYDTGFAILWYWNEIIAPAGILQNPIYDYTQPHYKTFGSLGALLGIGLHHVVDDYGKHYNKSGNYLGDNTWWTNKSISDYKPVESCVAEVYTNATSHLLYPDGSRRHIFIHGPDYAPEAIANINGVRLAMKGYRKWVTEQNIAEKMLPGLDHTDEQMLYLSYAQAHCFKHSSFWSRTLGYLGFLEYDLSINIALSQLPEFSEAFKCKKTAKMNAAKKCDYY